jgi:hypothetical protein
MPGEDWRLSQRTRVVHPWGRMGRRGKYRDDLDLGVERQLEGCRDAGDEPGRAQAVEVRGERVAHQVVRRIRATCGTAATAATVSRRRSESAAPRRRSPPPR